MSWCIWSTELSLSYRPAIKSKKKHAAINLINTLQSAVLSNAGLCEALPHTQAALTETNKPLLSFPNQLLSHHPLLSTCVRATSRPKVVSPVCASSTTKAPEQFDPVDSLGFALHRVNGECCS